MNLDEITALWQAYRRADVNMAIDPEDHMATSRGQQLEAGERVRRYELVGREGARTIASVLALSPTTKVRRILDFGSGHGRVGRHIRAMFPDAEMFFSDVL